jgi:hypothetical protein
MRRIKNRLFDLESSTGAADGAASPAGQRLLVEILARRDAAFWPWRYTTADNDYTNGALIRERQQAILERKQGIAVKADGKNNWKSASSIRLELVGAGLVDAIRSSGQVQSLLLTDLGEALARSLVGPRLKTIDHAALLFERLLQCEAERKQTGKSLVGEGLLFGKTLAGNPSAWEHWFEPMLPLLTAGFVRATSDTQGRIVFSTNVSTLPMATRFDADPLAGADELYLQAYEAERLQLAKLSGGCEIFIPCPAMAGL